MLNYANYINTVIKPELTNTVFTKAIEDLTSIFGMNEPIYEGSIIKETFKVAVSTSAAAYVKGDPNPASFSETLINPYWTKVQYHEAVEVSKIDLSNAGNDGKRQAMIDKAMAQGGANLYGKVFDGCMTQLASDVDSSGAYSDASLSRSTYPTLASHEENTATAITLAYLRAARKACFLNKNVGAREGYVWLLEEAVNDTAEPLMAATRSYIVNDTSTQTGVDTGNPPVSRFEGSNVFVPKGLTTGLAFFVRKQDVLVCPHRPFEIEQVDSGADTMKWILRVGINLHCINPGFQAKLTNKS